MREAPSSQHTTEHNSYQNPFLQQPHPLPWSPATDSQPPLPSPGFPPPPNHTPWRCLSIAAGNRCKGCSTPPLQRKELPGSHCYCLFWKVGPPAGKNRAQQVTSENGRLRLIFSAKHSHDLFASKVSTAFTTSLQTNQI